jgi:hypothetical protein
MMLSEYIDLLQAIGDEHGDLEIRCFNVMQGSGSAGIANAPKVDWIRTKRPREQFEYFANKSLGEIPMTKVVRV